MTNKELILDCLVDGSEAETQIKKFFDFVGVEISIHEIRNLLNKMLDEELVCVDEKWVNEFGEKPYSLTTKGRNVWRTIK